MKFILVFVVVGLFLYFIVKVLDWSESDNKAKQNIGCTFMAVLIGGVMLLSVFGVFKQCTSCDKSPSREYYDSPRK